MAIEPDIPQSEATVGLALGRSARWLWILGILAAVLIPFAISDSYYLRIVNLIAIFALLALGLNLLIGYTGQLSVGQAAFYGIGSYTSAILTTTLGWPFWGGFIAAGVVAAFFGLAIGPITRLRGMFLAVATLGFGEVVRIVVINWVSLTNGPNGISRLPAPAIGPLVLDDDQRYYFLVLATLAFAYFATYRLIHSRVGRAMEAVRDNEDGAAAAGVEVARYKVMVFVVSAFFAGLAGSLYAHLTQYISPENLTFNRSVEVIFMVVLGGIGSLPGSILGSAVVVALPELLRSAQDARLLIYSAAILLVLIFVRGGLAGLFAGFATLVWRQWRKRSRSSTRRAPA